MMRYAIVLAAGLTLAGCAQDRAGSGTDTTTGSQAASMATLPPEVQRAVAVRRGVEAAPDKADSVLTANGFTIAGFDSLMYRIAADSSLRAAFATAH